MSAIPLLELEVSAEFEFWVARVVRFVLQLQASEHLYELRRLALAFAVEQPFFRQAVWLLLLFLPVLLLERGLRP